MYRLAVPIEAYLSTVYGDSTAPALTVEVADDSGIDWVAETVLLQIVQEALHNVWRHSRAARVTVSIGVPDAGGIVLSICDDGIGFEMGDDAGPGIAAMRASAAVLDGHVEMTSRPGQGTTVVAYLAPGGQDPRGREPSGQDAPARPRLRLVADGPGVNDR